MDTYIKRTLRSAIEDASLSFRVLLLTGPRQVGKTTLLQEIQKDRRSYVTLDDINMRTAAQEDPASFIERLRLPTLIDEVQYAPNLFPYIKIAVDQSKQPGMFWLTGSQQFDMMKNVRESLAGRVAVLNLQGISLAEEQNRANSAPFLPTWEIIKERQQSAQVLTLPDHFFKIWRGSYPDVVMDNGKNWERFYESYVATYIQRDVREYLQITDQVTFHKFMQVVAAHTGQMVNYANVARNVGVSEPTVKAWLGVLQASGIIYLLQPYSNNHLKRLIKTPKLHFMDTGLCCFLTGWLNADVLERGAMSGTILESYVVSEIIKSYLHNGRTPRVYYYRDKEKREVDLLIEENGVLYPIEVKKSAALQKVNSKGFEALKTLSTPIGYGGLLCFVKNLLPVSKNVDAIPIGFI
ncbi:MAG: ATP-binding protein [Pseudomonadota bacterium]